jgi:hypothetical protein
VESDKDAAVIAGLDQTWAKIQKLEPGVPDVGWYLTSGRSSSCATGPWGSEPPLVLRLNLIKGGDNRDGNDLLGQFLHWAAHAAVGISTGAEGRYHSREFADVAGQFGLETTWRDGVGYSPASPPVVADKTLRLFAPEIKAIDKAMAVWEPVEEDAARKSARGPITLRCECDPRRMIFMSTGTALGADITCSACRKPFRVIPAHAKRLEEAAERMARTKP